MLGPFLGHFSQHQVNNIIRLCKKAYTNQIYLYIYCLFHYIYVHLLLIVPYKAECLLSLIREVVHSLAHWLQFPLDLAEFSKGMNGKLEVLETIQQPGSADGFVGISQTTGSPKTQGLV